MSFSAWWRKDCRLRCLALVLIHNKIKTMLVVTVEQIREQKAVKVEEGVLKYRPQIVEKNCKHRLCTGERKSNTKKGQREPVAYWSMKEKKIRVLENVVQLVCQLSNLS